MAGKLRLKRLGEICEFRGGQGFPQKHQGAIVGDYPFIKVSDMELPGNGHRITRANHWIDEATRKELRAKPHPATSTVFAKIGVALTYNRRRLLSRPTIVDNNMMAAVPIESEVEPLFLYYLLKQTDFNEVVSGTALPFLNGSDLAKMEVEVPPLAEQKAIAAVLGSLDDKIELNRRMNETLEAMARALFQSWFVDFDPVRVKLDGRKPAGLDKGTAALFPATFHDSPIGPVPKGWKAERFDAHITADRGLSYNGAGLRDDGSGLPMHNLNSVYEGGGYKHEGLKYYGGEYREKHLLKPGDMIVTNTEQGFDHLLIGHAAIVPGCYGPKGIFSHHIYRVRFKSSSPFSPHYLVELFNNRRWHYWISGFSNGTTINMLPMDALEMPMLVVPPVELVKKFTALAEAVHLQVEDNKQQSRTLAALRDTLLPKLLSGEVWVAASEKILAMTALSH